MALNKKEIEKLLKNEEIAYIATARPDGTPHIAPIWFVLHDGKIYFETDTTTVKYKNIQHKNKIALCFGGEETYIIEGSVKEYKEDELDFPIRKLYWDKYKYMDDSFITEKTHLFEVVPEKELSWHYAPEWD